MSFSIIKLDLLEKKWYEIKLETLVKSRGVCYCNTKGKAFKFVSHPLAVQKQGEKEINKHQSFISAQFSSFGEQRIPYGKRPRHPNFRQLDSPFNQVSGNRDSNQLSHSEFHSQNRPDYGAGRITAHYWLEINFQGLRRTGHNKAGGGLGEFNSVTNWAKWDLLGIKKGQSYNLTFWPYLPEKYSTLEKKKKGDFKHAKEVGWPNYIFKKLAINKKNKK